MAALTTEQLECLLGCVIPNSVPVLGVFPANCVPLRCVTSTIGRHTVQLNLEVISNRQSQLAPNEHCCFILNTHPSGEPGEHWLAFLFNGHTRKLEFFDSFGFPLEMYSEVNAALLSCQLLPMCVRANSVGMLQSMSSAVCGHFCVAYLYWRVNNMTTAVGSFAHRIMGSHASDVQRDKLVVARLRTLTVSHPCCATQLFNSNIPHSFAQSTTRMSQSCCCGARFIH
jgi:hypothetical protein